MTGIKFKWIQLKFNDENRWCFSFFLYPKLFRTHMNLLYWRCIGGVHIQEVKKIAHRHVERPTWSQKSGISLGVAQLMTLIPEIDEHACRDDARNLLKKYLWQARIAGRPLTDGKSPTITDMPEIPSIWTQASPKSSWFVPHHGFVQELISNERIF